MSKIGRNLKVAEVDGNPSVVPVHTVKIPNGNLTKESTGVVSIDCISSSQGDARYLKLDQPVGSEQITTGVFTFPEADATTVGVNGTIGVTITGGDETTDGIYTIRTFKSSTVNKNFVTNSPIDVEVLVVAGGGAGGVTSLGNSGGGGAGGVIYKALHHVVAGTYAITVGAGGVYGASVNGGNSIFDSLTAVGGGFGGTYNTMVEGYYGSGASGGSGGGCAQYDGNPAYAGTPTSGQGNYGGNQVTGGYAGAGGGGAGGIGGDPTDAYGNYENGGVGGDGVAYSISGSSQYYAGGGAGSTHSSGTGATAGGSGVGGTGAFNGTPGTDGAADTGSGGGGAGEMYGGGNGADGIVIIRYLTPAAQVPVTRKITLSNDLFSFEKGATFDGTVKGTAIYAGQSVPQSLSESFIVSDSTRVLGGAAQLTKALFLGTTVDNVDRLAHFDNNDDGSRTEVSFSNSGTGLWQDNFVSFMVHGLSFAGGNIYLPTIAGKTTDGGWAYLLAQGTAQSGTAINNYNATPIVLGTNNIPRLYVGGTTGNVLIGTTTDDNTNKLQVTGNAKFTSISETTPTLFKLDQTTPQTVINGTPEFSRGITLNPTNTVTDGISLTLTSNNTTTIKRAGIFNAVYDSTSATSLSINGINAQAGTATTASGNVTATTAGGGLRNRYLINHLGSGTVTKSSTLTARTIATGGNITTAANYLSEAPSVGTGKTVATFSHFNAEGAAITGTITNLYGLLIGDISAGTTLNYAIKTGVGQVLFGDKLAFTQTDGNEYIDSLNDGFMDYGATTAHRFLSNVKLTADNRSLILGAGDDASIYYDGTNMLINPKLVGTGFVSILGGLKTSGNRIAGITNATDTYAILTTDETVVCNKTTAFTVTLPTAVVGQKFTIKNIGAGVVTVKGASSDTIDGDLNQSIIQWESMQVQCYVANAWGVM